MEASSKLTPKWLQFIQQFFRKGASSKLTRKLQSPTQMSFRRGAPSKPTRKWQPFIQESFRRGVPFKLTLKWQPFVQQWLRRGAPSKLTQKWWQPFIQQSFRRGAFSKLTRKRIIHSTVAFEGSDVQTDTTMTTICSTVPSKGSTYWHENDNPFFNGPYGGENHQNWQRTQPLRTGASSKQTRSWQPFIQQSHPRGAPSKPTRKWQQFFNCGSGAKNRLYQHEIDNRLFHNGFGGKNR